jgi:hypothetical protein
MKVNVLEIINRNAKQDAWQFMNIQRLEDSSVTTPKKPSSSVYNRSSSKNKLSITLAKEGKTSVKKEESSASPMKNTLFYSATNNKLLNSSKSNKN